MRVWNTLKVDGSHAQAQGKWWKWVQLLAITWSEIKGVACNFETCNLNSYGMERSKLETSWNLTLDRPWL